MSYGPALQRIRHNNIRDMDDFKLQEGTFWNSDVVFWKVPSTSTVTSCSRRGGLEVSDSSPLTGLGPSPPSPMNTPQLCGPLPGALARSQGHGYLNPQGRSALSCFPREGRQVGGSDINEPLWEEHDREREEEMA